MFRVTILSIFVLAAMPVGGQPAELEVDGVFGECVPTWAAATDGLHLYREPDLRAEEIRVPYRVGWRIPAPKASGMTRVLRIGSLRVREPDPLLHCSSPPTEGSSDLVRGEIVRYLYYVGEGFGEITFRGGQCQAEVAEDFGYLLELPEVQVWLRVFFGDGSSPGWLLHDGSQTQVADVSC